MKAIVLIVAAILAALFILSFGSGLGYAKGGGEVRILTDEVIASSESGQAVAVGWSDIDTFNASNTPAPKPAPGRTILDAAPMLALVGLMLVAVVMFIGHLKPAGDSDWQADPDAQPHHSAKEAAEYKRSYGPL